MKFAERFQQIVRFIRSLTSPKKEIIPTMNTTRNTQSLLLRPRRASESRRRTQIQLPLALLFHPFFSNVTSISNAFGDTHRLVFAHARGRLNTVKVEIPEIEKMVSPVVKLTRDENGNVTYVAYDSFVNSVGREIENKLHDGIGGSTRSTMRPGRTYRATLYQFATV